MGDRTDILSTLGYVLQERGELDEALEILSKSIELQADPQTHSNVMMVMCYHPGVTPERHFEAHGLRAIFSKCTGRSPLMDFVSGSIRRVWWTVNAHIEALHC